MKGKYWIIGILIGLAICLALLFWPDKQHDTHSDDKSAIIATHDALKAHDAISARIIDSLNKVIAGKDSANKKLREGQAVTRQQLDLKSSEVKTLVAQIREINQDTGYFGHLLDSLEEQVESLTFLIVQYEQYADSINNMNDSSKINYEAIIKEKDKRLAELQSAYDNLYKAYNELFDITKGLMKDLKRQKLKTKVAAVLGAGAAVIMLLK